MKTSDFLRQVQTMQFDASFHQDHVRSRWLQEVTDIFNQLIKENEELREEVKNRVVKPQQPPDPNDLPAVWDMVISDMKSRDDFGKNKYGTSLQPFNGRDAMTDAYQEALDLCVYLRQAIYERDGK